MVFWPDYHAVYRHYLVKERGPVDRAFRRASFAFDLAKGAAEAFCPLKAVLQSISVVYTKYQVRFDTPFDFPSDGRFPECWCR